MKNKQVLLSHSIYTAVEGQELVDGYLVLEEGRIAKLAHGEPSSADLKDAQVHDFRGQTITPGLVDAHTHLVHGGSREQELALKLAGASYMEIHQEGGIKSTMRATREATEAELLDKALATLLSMLQHGTTTVETKSGYGLDKETELRVLRINRELNKLQPLDLVSTYMGAHDTPPEFPDQAAYIKFILEEVMPQVQKEKLAEFCDIFCEEGIFSLEETREIGEAAKRMGFKLKIHADEIVPMGGAGLAADLGAVSSEHLMAIADEDIPKLAKSGTVAVLLPATTFFLRSEHFAPAKKMWDQGVTVAIASDYNPGSSPCENLQMAMDMACLGMGLQPLQILKAVTLNAAKAICRDHEIGSLEVGKRADLTIFKALNPDYIFYHFGLNRVSHVFKDGWQVLRDGQIDQAALQSVLRTKR
ncbi:MAG: imidazolonepropionase [Eubacteriales bacterium]|nr:imidazolonepropionase [Clostridiales bacterium]MDY5836848.1 imidazolonepropionase [Eubacteriales bacterium]